MILYIRALLSKLFARFSATKSKSFGLEAYPSVNKNPTVDGIGFRIRLRARIAKSLSTEATSLTVLVANKNITITSQDKKTPLSNAKWIVLGAGGFATEEEAQNFGDQLRAMLQLAALSSRLGVDVGEDKPSGWMSEHFARSMGFLKEHERIAPNIHGLLILPDDDYTRIPIVDAQATVTATPEHLMSALRELGEHSEINLGPAQNGVRLLNLALMNSDPLAQMVLAISAVEELGQNQRWSDGQRALIEQLAQIAEASEEVSTDERAEVVRAIRTGLFPLSLRQGVIRLLATISRSELKKEWDRLYSIRSGVFHGTARLSAPELNQAALDTISLCGQIILSLVAKDGGTVPSIAATHFKPSTPPPNRHLTPLLTSPPDSTETSSGI